LGLKTVKKVSLITTYIILKFLYGIILFSWNQTWLHKADCEVKKALQDILHLQPSTTAHVLYAKRAMEGKQQQQPSM
jgi:hypothetical protein